MKVKEGTPATYQIGGDRYPYEVVDSTESGKTIWLVKIFLSAKPPLNKGKETDKATLRKNGYYRFVGSKCGMITLGKAEYYLSKEF